MCDRETFSRKMRQADISSVSWRLSRESIAVAARPGCPYSVAHETVAVIDEATKHENARRSKELRKWFAEGRCPRCGELGAMKACAPVCSVHGPYEFTGRPDPDAGYDPEEFFGEEDEEAQPAWRYADTRPTNRRVFFGADFSAGDDATAALLIEYTDRIAEQQKTSCAPDPEPSSGWCGELD